MKLARDYFHQIQMDFPNGFTISDSTESIQGKELSALIELFATAFSEKSNVDGKQLAVAICLDRTIYFFAAMAS